MRPVPWMSATLSAGCRTHSRVLYLELRPPCRYVPAIRFIIEAAA